jgi:16S rRNA (guanine527-N7)-methyltransferase
MQKKDAINHISKFYNITNQEIFNLEKFIEILLQYNQKMNLIGSSTITDIWSRHILDSAQLLQFIKDKNQRIADLGSGAGFPGVILSILGIKNITLIEKSPKKCQFLEKISEISPNKIHIINQNIIDIKNIKFDIITSRAFAPLNKLLKLSKNLTTDKTKYILLKGKNLELEINESKKELKNHQYQIFNSKTSSEGKIIVIQYY